MVDRLPARVIPDPAVALRYYGKTAPKEVYKARTVDRLVFQRPNGHYTVIPDVTSTKGLWHEA